MQRLPRRRHKVREPPRKLIDDLRKARPDRGGSSPNSLGSLLLGLRFDLTC